MFNQAILNYGYKLDCAEADSAYLAAIKNAEENARFLLNKAMTEWKKGQTDQAIFLFDMITEQYEETKEASDAQQQKALLLSQLNQQNTQIFSIEDFPQANTTWGEKLNPQGKLSTHGFLAFYINTNQPNTIIKSETVRDISINYSYDDFHGIKSQDFGAYWVGDIYFEKDEIKKVTASQSWSKARLIIDGHIVYEGGSDKELLLNFKAGKHRIEVEYINNWHTTEFALNILDSVKSLSMPEIKKRLSSNVLVDYSAYYVGLYESSSRDLSVTLDIAKTSESIVLILGSYSSIKWNISNPFGVDIRAIVYGSYKPGSTVVGNIDNTLLLPSKRSIGSYDIIPRCSCHASNFHCEGGGNLRSTKMGIESFISSKLAGFSGRYSAKSLQVPEIKITDRYLVELGQKMQKIQKQRELCRKERNPDFENMN